MPSYGLTWTAICHIKVRLVQYILQKLSGQLSFFRLKLRLCAFSTTNKKLYIRAAKDMEIFVKKTKYYVLNKYTLCELQFCKDTIKDVLGYGIPS